MAGLGSRSKVFWLFGAGAAPKKTGARAEATLVVCGGKKINKLNKYLARAARSRMFLAPLEPEPLEKKNEEPAPKP